MHSRRVGNRRYFDQTAEEAPGRGSIRHLEALKCNASISAYLHVPAASSGITPSRLYLGKGSTLDVDFWLMHRSRLQFGLTILTKAKGMRLKWLSRDET